MGSLRKLGQDKLVKRDGENQLAFGRLHSQTPSNTSRSSLASAGRGVDGFHFCRIVSTTGNIGREFSLILETMTNQDNVLTVSENTRLLKVTEKTDYCLAQKSDMRALKVGGQWQVSRTAVGSRIKTKTQVTIAQPADDGTRPANSKREEMEPMDE